MFKFEIIKNTDPKWNDVVKNADMYDFHHTAYFHKIDTDFLSELLVFSDNENFIALPVVKRPIEGTPLFDITSVYGYCGPVYFFKEGYTAQKLIDFFRSGFMEYCKEKHIVSVFSRLHPLIEQKSILTGLGEVLDLNRTVSVNLNLTSEEQRKEYRKSLKSELNQLRRKEIKVVEAVSREDIDEFISIYYETMDRVNAAPGYYFSRAYFYEFLDNADFDSKLLLAVKDDKAVAGAIFTFTDKIMQYHLAGTTEQFIKDTPMKLILDEARLLGNESTAESLHLGGGVGGSDDDSLFRFKSGFSKDFKQFSIWKWIVNQELYDELSREKQPSGFFPLYRS